MGHQGSRLSSQSHEVEPHTRGQALHRAGSLLKILSVPFLCAQAHSQKTKTKKRLKIMLFEKIGVQQICVFCYYVPGDLSPLVFPDCSVRWHLFFFFDTFPFILHFCTSNASLTDLWFHFYVYKKGLEATN